MKFLLDEGLPESLSSLLTALGHDTSHVRELGLAGADDPEVISLALTTGSVIVTLDADFHRELAVSGASGPSVVRFRTDGLRAAQYCDQPCEVAKAFESELKNGAAISIRKSRSVALLLPIHNAR